MREAVAEAGGTSTHHMPLHLCVSVVEAKKK